MESRCRLCSKKNFPLLIDVFSEEAISLKLQEKIISRMHIHVCREDYLPTTICVLCYSRLDQFDEFVESAHRFQDEMLHQLMGGIRYPRAIGGSVAEASTSRNIVENSQEADIQEGEPTIQEPIIQEEEGITQEPNDDEQELIIPEVIQEGEPIIELTDDIEIPVNVREVIEVSDDSVDENSMTVRTPDNDTTDLDSDVEFIQTDFNPSSIRPSVGEARKNERILAALLEVSKREATTMINGEAGYHTSIQVGNSLMEEQRSLKKMFATQNPGVPLSDMCVHTFQVSDKGNLISADRGCNKGGQVWCRYKPKTKIQKECNRTIWTPHQKEVMKKAFASHYRKKKAPTMTEIFQFMENTGSLFDEMNPVQIRKFFKNRKYSHKKR